MNTTLTFTGIKKFNQTTGPPSVVRRSGSFSECSLGMNSVGTVRSSSWMELR